MKNILFFSTGFCLSILLGACTPQTPTTPTPPVTTTEANQLPVQAEPQPAPQPLAQKKLTMASGDLAKLGDVMEKLIGEWHSMPENYNEEDKVWMSKNKISDYYDTFSWGTNKAWIDFGDYRVVDGKVEKTGVGMISWHSGFKHLRFRESGARGGLVDGMIEIKDENTFVRHYEFFSPKGQVSYSSDTWTFDPATPNCFIWQSTGYKGVEAVTYPGRKYCKK